MPYPLKAYTLQRALTLKYLHGLSDNAAAKQLDAPIRTIQRNIAAIEKILRPIEKVETYVQKRVSILTAIELKIIEHMADAGVLKRASINNLAYAFQQIHTARRLEEGKSTANIQYADAIRARAEVDRARKEISERYEV